MYKVAVLGDYDSIYGFATVGLETFPVDIKKPEEAAEILHRLAENEYAVVYITENLAVKLERDINRYKDSITPAIIQIPGVFGNTGNGVAGVKKNVEQAIGSDILFGDK